MGKPGPARRKTKASGVKAMVPVFCIKQKSHMFGALQIHLKALALVLVVKIPQPLVLLCEPAPEQSADVPSCTLHNHWMGQLRKPPAGAFLLSRGLNAG